MSTSLIRFDAYTVTECRRLEIERLERPRRQRYEWNSIRSRRTRDTRPVQHRFARWLAARLTTAGERLQSWSTQRLAE